MEETCFRELAEHFNRTIFQQMPWRDKTPYQLLPEGIRVMHVPDCGTILGAVSMGHSCDACSHLAIVVARNLHVNRTGNIINL